MLQIMSFNSAIYTKCDSYNIYKLYHSHIRETNRYIEILLILKIIIPLLTRECRGLAFGDVTVFVERLKIHKCAVWAVPKKTIRHYWNWNYFTLYENKNDIHSHATDIYVQPAQLCQFTKKRNFSTITSRVSASARRRHCRCRILGQQERKVRRRIRNFSGDHHWTTAVVTTARYCCCCRNIHADITDETVTTRLVDHRSVSPAHRVAVLVLTQQLELSYNALKILMYRSSMPQYFSIFHKDGLWTLSNAFMKSMKFMMTYFRCVRLFSMTFR